MPAELFADYFSISFKNIHDFLVIKSLIPCEFAQMRRGFRNYDSGLSAFGNAIQMLYHTDQEVQSGFNLVISGDGCRFLESMGIDLRSFCAKCLEFDSKVTRIDIAFDTNVVTPYELFPSIRDRSSIRTRATDYKFIYSNKGDTVYIGDRSSATYLRIYDKNAQMGIKSSETVTRFEYEIKEHKAQAIAKLFIQGDFKNITSFCHEFCQFLNPNEAHENVSRRSVARWFNELLGFEKFRVPCKKFLGSIVERAHRFVDTQVGPTLACIYLVFGDEGVLQYARNNISKLTAKHLNLINAFKAVGKPGATHITAGRAFGYAS